MTTMCFIDPAHWGRGFASEAMRGFLEWVIGRFAPDAIEAVQVTGNPGSARLLEKLARAQIGTGTGTSAARPHPGPMGIWRRPS